MSRWRIWREAAAMLVGMPSYERYLLHMAECHPDRPAMSRREFFRNRQQARYGHGAGPRCC